MNVSRMSMDRLTGPGGFIDISQSTRNVCFMTSFTAKGLCVSLPGDGTIGIEKEGKVRKFVNDVLEKTFSGNEAVRRGQQVFYVTERAVFRRTAKHDVIELIEIAPGVDLEKDILAHMDFEPAISPNLRVMEKCIFARGKMNVLSDFFGSLEDRCRYHADDHTMYLDLFGVTLNSTEDVTYFFDGLTSVLHPMVEEKGKLHMVINYDGFDLGKGLEEQYQSFVDYFEEHYYASVRRFSGDAFRRASLGKGLKMSDAHDLFDEFDLNGDGVLSNEELRLGFSDKFQMKLTPSHMRHFQKDEAGVLVDRDMFVAGVKKVLESAAS